MAAWTQRAQPQTEQIAQITHHPPVMVAACWEPASLSQAAKRKERRTKTSCLLEKPRAARVELVSHQRGGARGPALPPAGASSLNQEPPAHTDPHTCMIDEARRANDTFPPSEESSLSLNSNSDSSLSLRATNKRSRSRGDSGGGVCHQRRSWYR